MPNIITDDAVIAQDNARIELLSREVKSIFDSVEDVDKLDESQKTLIKSRNDEIKQLESKVADRMKLIDAKVFIDGTVKRFEEVVRPDGLGFKKELKSERKTVGETFVDHELITNWLGQHKHLVGSNANSKLGSSPVVELKDLYLSLLQQKTLVTGLSSTSAGAFVQNDRLPGYDLGTFMRPLGIIDLFRRIPTSSDTVEYVRVNGNTNNAAPVLEATTTSNGAKPESAFTLEIVTEIIQNIAHWIPVTRRALADAPQIRALINEILMYGLGEEVDDQLVTGDGSTPNLTGLENQSGTTSQAWDTDILTTTRKARTKVRTTGRGRASGYVLHPTDWETIDLLTDNEARFYFGGPSQLGTPRLWGLPVVENEAITPNSGWVADWNLGVVFDREAAQMYMTDSHSDFFIRNIITILAELRLGFGLIRPAAFVNIDLSE